MRVSVLFVIAAALVAGPAAAQSLGLHYDSYGQPIRPFGSQPAAGGSRASSSGYAPFAQPQSPPEAKGFTPFKGTSVYSTRGGVYAYPEPAKPNNPARSLFGPKGPK